MSEVGINLLKNADPYLSGTTNSLIQDLPEAVIVTFGWS